MTELEQTKGKFQIIGEVTRLDRDGAYREDISQKGIHEGETYRSLRFGVKTSPENEVFVEMFAFEPAEVYLWNSSKKKKDKNYKGDKVNYSVWVDKKDELRAQGYTCLQTSVGLELDKGKPIRHGYPAYEAIEEIYNGLTNGDKVAIEGEINYSSYEKENGEIQKKKQFNIKKIVKVKDFDFEADDFEEVAGFEQEAVFVDAEIDKEEKRTYVTLRVINYKGDYEDTQMIVDFSDGDKDMEKLAKAMTKLNFGDLITVFGEIVNKPIITEAEDDDDDNDDDLFAKFGGKKKPKFLEQPTFITFETALKINGVSDYKEKVYTEEDFVKDDLINNDDDNIFGGKSKKKNPFVFDEEDDDDALPFL